MNESEWYERGKVLGRLQYQTEVEKPLQDVLDLCPEFANKLTQTKSLLYDDFDYLWSKVLILHEVLLKPVEESNPLTIKEQFDLLCNDGTDEVICPNCNTEIHQYYHWAIAADDIEHGRCPICDCEWNNGTYEWCIHCTNWCDERKLLEERAEYERHVDSQIAFMRGK